jgi:uncharacterized protein with FMN-binding domain
VTVFYYNQMMELSNALDEANQRIETASARQTESGRLQKDVSNAASSLVHGIYVDGRYEGTAEGYGGAVTVEVIVTNGCISGIEVLSSENEDAAYYNMALDVLDRIIDSQGVDVDVVSGATYTSNGIINGAKDALSKAMGE